MNIARFRPHTTARAAHLLLGSSLALLCLYGAMAQSQPQPQTQTQSQAGSASSTTPQSDDAAAKAAERKRRYDEQRKLLEGGVVSAKDESRGRVDPDLVLSPMEVNLLVRDQLAIHLYDKGKEVSGASWSAMPGRILGSWFNHGIFYIEAKSPGTARVGAVIGSRHTNIIVTVYPGDKMPKGVERTVDMTPLSH
jgi:hypothetical protein